MCNPVALGPAAVATAGSVYSGMEASDNARRTQEARNAATMAEVERGKAYGDKSRAVFDTSLNSFKTDPSGAQEATRAAISGNAPSAAQVGTISTGNGPQVVADREGSKLASVFTRNAGLDNALGTLKGYDANTTNNQLNLNQSGRDINTIGDFAKTSANVNAVEQRAAGQNAYKPPSGIGEILQTAGKIGGYYGGKGFTFGTPGASPVPSSFNGVGAAPY